MDNIWGPLITGFFSVIAVMITNSRSNEKISHQLEMKQAVTDEKIKQLTDEVRRHNDFATRMPRLEEKIDNITDKVKHLEGYHQP